MGPVCTLILEMPAWVWPCGKPDACGGERALFGIGEGSLSSAFWPGCSRCSLGVGEHLCPLQGGPFIICLLCRLSCVTGLVRGGRNSSLHQGARISAWNPPKGRVSIGGLVLHFVYFQNPALALLSLAAVGRNRTIECQRGLYCHLVSPLSSPTDEETEVHSGNLTCARMLCPGFIPHGAGFG